MMARGVLASAAALAVAGCNLAPVYRPPATVAIPATFKEQPGWVPGQPADDVAKGEWWRLFGDPVLDDLCARVAISNQTVAQYRAAYLAARALTQESRAALFPTVGAGFNATKSGGSGGGTTTTTTGGVTTIGSGNQRFVASLSASWEPDLWGRLGNAVSQARAGEQASAGDLANAELSARAELASDYFQLRGIDAQRELQAATIAAYERALTISTNKYRAGTVSRQDVESARASLANAQADRRESDRQRAVLEHAIAMLVGDNPSTFALAPAAWRAGVPAVPGVLPSALLQRRPDVAAAERRVAAANAGIGIQRAAWFPQLGLSAGGSLSATTIGDLVAAPISVWSLGLTAAQTLLDFGARSARVAQARAQFDQAAAVYRQTVLVAFQQVEDNLAGVAAYGDEAALRETASVAADRAETIARNQYEAGTSDFTAVIVAQTAAYQARTARVNAVVARQTATVSLIAAIGGRWQDRDSAAQAATVSPGATNTQH